MTEFKQAPVVGSKRVDAAAPGTKAKVYFTRTIDAEHLLKLYNLVNENIYGKVAIKLHTGEKHGPNILPRDMVKAFQAAVPESAIVETNTLYAGDRYTTEGHRDTLKVNGWTFCPVDILDEEGDVALPVRNGLRLKEVHMGGHLTNYDSLIVLTHFKGHAISWPSTRPAAIWSSQNRKGTRRIWWNGSPAVTDCTSSPPCGNRRWATLNMN